MTRYALLVKVEKDKVIVQTIVGMPLIGVKRINVAFDDLIIKIRIGPLNTRKLRISDSSGENILAGYIQFQDKLVSRPAQPLLGDHIRIEYILHADAVCEFNDNLVGCKLEVA